MQPTSVIREALPLLRHETTEEERSKPGVLLRVTRGLNSSIQQTLSGSVSKEDRQLLFNTPKPSKVTPTLPSHTPL